ncbi:MAG: serine/threonine protein kinase, partial [Kofleriaceae bacterium]|nr:serine/threonine protein kinase [Kofleriaceae bacterium]
MRRPVKFGKYLLLDRISIGGMAEVFKAKTFGLEGFEKIVAIKRILPALGKDPDFVDMFIDEAKISGQLAHANIGQIHELGKVDDAHFIAMEFIWGRDLLQLQNRYRKNKKRLSTRTACYIVMKVCEGLQYAHKKRDVMGQEMKIVHRDCSPQNIVVSFEGEVKLIDFGIAKAEQRNAHTTAGVLKGKFAYMSPEQVRGLPLDRRTDIFSMGIILYESLTGKRLFNGENDFTTLEKVRNAIVESKELLAASVPPEVERIVRKALAKNAESRYQWCAEMRDDLNAYLKSSEDVFSNRVLGQEMSQAFGVELERERELMDVYARIDKDGVLADAPGAAPVDTPGSVSPVSGQEDDYSEVLVEQSELLEEPELLELAPQPAPNEYVDSPTEIFGELGLMDVIGDVEDIGSAQPLTSDGESIKIEVADPELLMIEVETPAPTPAPGPAPTRPRATSALSEAPMDSGVQPFGSFAPAVATAVTVAPGASPTITMSFPEVSTTESVPNPGIRLNTSPGTVANRNTLLGIGLAVAVILVALGVKTVFFGAEKPAAASTAHATLVLLVDDKESAVAFVDGKERGFVPSGDSLTLDNLSPGSHSIQIQRNGVALCDAKLKLNENKIKVFNCDPTSLAVGMLNIEGLEDGDTLVVDGTPVTGEELARPLTLKANKQHRVALSRPGRGFMEFRVTLTPGEKRVHTLVWPEETPDADAGVEEFMDMKPDRVAPGGERDKYQDRKKAAEERRKNGAADKFSLGKIPTVTTKKGGSDPQATNPNDNASEESGVGYLTVWSEPWARIYIDGKDTGKQTPVV